jgi:hypothetical protein
MLAISNLAAAEKSKLLRKLMGETFDSWFSQRPIL